MNIESDIRAALERTGWNASRLAREAGVKPPIVTRILAGTRKGLHSDTLAKLWPFLHPDTPTTLPQDAA